MRDEDIRLIRQLPLFATAKAETLSRLTPPSFLQRFPQGVQLIREGEMADFLHIVVEGSVELYAQANNRETTVAILRPVTAFILAAVIKDAVYLMSARTLKDSRILMIPAPLLRDSMEADNAFAHAMIYELARGFRTMVRAVKNQKLRTAAERLANYLLIEERSQGGKGELRLPYEKRLLASYLGITPENLSRAFRSLEPYGVEVRRNLIAIKDQKALRQLGKPNPLIDDAEEW